MLIDKVKLALRITHGALDALIEDTIASARAEMIRSGIDAEKASDDDDDLISQAIVTYCLSIHSNANNDVLERYNGSWLYQLDCLRKSSNYRASND